MFSKKELRQLIGFLFAEQFLQMLVGLADTFIVSFAGEADVSGVSLVTAFNLVLVLAFSALASGGAVIISQYLGDRNKRMAGRAVGQLLMISFLLSVGLMGIILVFQTQILHLLFGRIEPDVMRTCEEYLFITTLSLPALAMYNAGAALCRSIGKTNVTMYISAAANLVNIIGNCIGVFSLHLGAAGVAYPSLLSRIVSAAAIFIYCGSKRCTVRLRISDVFFWDAPLLRKILGVAIPNGVENGVHQLVKVAISGIVAMFGTYQIAAIGVAQSIWAVGSIAGIALAPVYTTVIGQCMGAKNVDAANGYFRKLNKITFWLSVGWNALIFGVTPFLMRYYAISEEAKTLVIWLVLINSIFNGLFYPFAGAMANGLRAAGDVKFTMIVSLSLTVGARLILTVALGIWLGWGAIGVAIGMSLDLLLRAVLFLWRYHSQKWTYFQLI